MRWWQLDRLVQAGEIEVSDSGATLYAGGKSFQVVTPPEARPGSISYWSHGGSVTAVAVSSVPFLRFVAWCAQQRRESRQRIEQMCSETRARLFPGKVYIAPLGTPLPGRFPTDQGWTFVGTMAPELPRP